nr:MAG: capsid protein [Wufeng shrew picorna-like virus 8]
MAAAQATPQASGDGLIVDSAETSSTIVSGIAAPPADSTTDVVPHTGQFNNYDPILNEQFIATANITWSTSQLPGTLLWSTRIHPDNCNQFIKHISQMYNAWAGSLDFRLKIAGTGFHAGALMVVRLPPNIDPTTLSTLSDVTAFEYALIDPKQLSVVDRSIMDQRNILYHYRNNLDPDDPNSFGGYFAVYVAMQLNTSSTGLNQINVQLWTRAGPDLIFSQLRPISVNPSAVGIDLFKLFFGDQATCALTGTRCLMKVQPSTQITTTIDQSAYRFKMDGLEASGLDPNRFKIFSKFRWNVSIDAPLKTFVIKTLPELYDDNSAYPAWPYVATLGNSANFVTATIFGPVGGQEITGFKNNSGTVPTQYLSFSNPYNGGVNNWTGDVGSYNYATFLGSLPLDFFTQEVQPMGEQYYPYTVSKFAPPISESIVLFASEFSYMNSVKRQQTLEMIAAARKGTFKGILNPDQAVLFEMKDRLTDLPVAYVKLYNDGSLTMKASSTEILYSYENYYFVPVFITQATQPIPMSVEHARNYYLATKGNGDRRLNRTSRQAAVAAAA